MKKWMKSFPKKEGWYWFYGYIFKRELKKELCIVNVRKIANGFMYICNGNFMYEKETGKGKFIPATLPKLPITQTKERN